MKGNIRSSRPYWTESPLRQYINESVESSFSTAPYFFLELFLNGALFTVYIYKVSYSNTSIFSAQILHYHEFL